MSSDTRPDSDGLLAATQKAEARLPRGKLKIFLGMVAGVGKTYAMLEAAVQRKSEGVDVVVGYVETHGRPETEALLAGLPLIPRRQIEYPGGLREELDLDTILARKPELVLVDELAHTNIAGTRHEARYQDILELLSAGINVYTTVNVQHFLSRADAVQRITGVVVRETVPDSLLDVADDIELIDLAPHELLKRLAEGKVYTADRAELATGNFFRQGNLTALREMALRLTAERVDHQLQDYMTIKQIPGPWKSGDRLMVAVSPSPLSQRLVRWTRRMAYSLEAPWIAVYVEVSRPLTANERIQLSRNLDLVRELGGEAIVTTAEDVTTALLRIAHQRNVTQIVIGKPPHRALQDFFSGGSLVNRMVRDSGEIDVFVVTGDESEATERPRMLPPQLHSRLNQYLLMLLVVGVTVGINGLLRPFISYQAVGLILLFMVLILSLAAGRGPVLVAAALSAILWNFVFIPPVYAFTIHKIEDVVMVGLYFVIAIVTGNLTTRLRNQERSIRQREERTQAVYALAREVASDVTIDDVLQTAVNQIKQLFRAEVAVFLTDSTGHLSAHVHPTSTFVVDAKERIVAVWSFENRKKAGLFTNTLSMAAAQYLPLLTQSGVFGVVGIQPEPTERLALDQEVLLDTFMSQIALAVERTVLDKAAQHAAVLQESERLYDTLLNSISHELRTPLATISGATSGLLNEQISSNPEARLALGQDLQEATERLNRLVDNLLNMTRLESGHLKLNLEWCDVADLINVSRNRVEKQLKNHQLITDVAPHLPLIRIDFVLMEQAIVNLLHNAALYTPPGTRIRLLVQRDGNALVISVADRGPGLPNTVQPFEKFYRAPGTGAGGTGLGLSISRGLVEAHGGTLTAENRLNGGARFMIRLPITPMPELPEEVAL